MERPTGTRSGGEARIAHFRSNSAPWVCGVPFIRVARYFDRSIFPRGIVVTNMPFTLAQASNIPLHALDLFVLVFSVVAVTIFGMYVGRKEEGTSDYFLAGKSVAWWAVAG